MQRKLYTVQQARQLAKRRLPRIIFDYIDGAAGNESSAIRNQTAFDLVQLQPRSFIHIDEHDISREFLGKRWQLPFGIAPMGMCNLAWPETDRMLAELATDFTIPLGVSTAASTSLEDMAAAANGNAWFQLYVGQSIEQAFSMVQRVEAAGYETLILTVDAQKVAPRPRDLINGFGAPIKIGPKQFMDFALHPHWSLRSLAHGVPQIANFDPDEARRAFARDQKRGQVDWDFLQRLRERWRGKLLVKGVMHPADASRVAELGADGIYVSNHGGRQLASAPAALDMLPLIRQAVGSEFPLVFDSGVRGGESIIKTYALGADFVMLGRPFLYAAAAAGEMGLRSLIGSIRVELEAAMTQIGCSSISEFSQQIVVDNDAVQKWQ